MDRESANVYRDYLLGHFTPEGQKAIEKKVLEDKCFHVWTPGDYQCIYCGKDKAAYYMDYRLSRVGAVR